jgi:hypothetical protein
LPPEDRLDETEVAALWVICDPEKAGLAETKLLVRSVDETADTDWDG